MQDPYSIHKVVHQEAIDECLNASEPPCSKAGKVEKEPPALEIRYGMDAVARQGAIPVKGHRTPSRKLLVRVKRRRRRSEQTGIFTAEVVGSVNNTVRFKSMADYQYTPACESGVAKIARAVRDLDYDQMLIYEFPDLNERYYGVDEYGGDEVRSLMDLQSTPHMSNRLIPYPFNFKTPLALDIEYKVDHVTGEARKRYFNKQRPQPTAPEQLRHDQGPVPTNPKREVQERLGALDEGVLARIGELFDQRPVWLREALVAQLSDDDRTKIAMEKAYISAHSYGFSGGPFQKTSIRLGYDPRLSREAHLYQRFFFYGPVKRARNEYLVHYDEDEDDFGDQGKDGWDEQVAALVAAGKRPPPDPKLGHIFDGQMLHRDHRDFILCDITDPQIVKYIYDEQSLCPESEYDIAAGWYKPISLDLIRTLLKSKYFYIRDHHAPPPESFGRNLERAYAEINARAEKEARENESRKTGPSQGQENPITAGEAENSHAKDGDAERAEAENGHVRASTTEGGAGADARIEQVDDQWLDHDNDPDGVEVAKAFFKKHLKAQPKAKSKTQILASARDSEIRRPRGRPRKKKPTDMEVDK
ncbi:tau 95 subunit of transcription factor TFIIIC [Cryptotrichosporon argae]